MIFLELLFGIPSALVLIAFAVVLTAFLHPPFARWLEARAVPRWPRTKGWFYDETTEDDESSPASELSPNGTTDPAPPTSEDPFGTAGRE
jgi:hypothetical protein